MTVEQFEMGGDRNYGYLIVDDESGNAAVIDPCNVPQKIVDYARDRDFSIVYAFNTHLHHDHVNGNARFEKMTNVKVLCFGMTEPNLGITIDDGATLPLGEANVRIMHTPGHTRDSMAILTKNAVITGDTLFVGKVGGTSSIEDAQAEYNSLHDKLMLLPDNFRVYPGHDYGTSPTSTIGEEKRSNPFILQPDFEAFVHLKKNWAIYKREHGIS